jgi:hypothetical protein
MRAREREGAPVTDRIEHQFEPREPVEVRRRTQGANPVWADVVVVEPKRREVAEVLRARQGTRAVCVECALLKVDLVRGAGAETIAGEVERRDGLEQRVREGAREPRRVAVEPPES